jgi:hypothetical protein
MIEGVKDEEEDVRFHRHDQFNVFEDLADYILKEKKRDIVNFFFLKAILL